MQKAKAQQRQECTNESCNCLMPITAQRCGKCGFPTSEYCICTSCSSPFDPNETQICYYCNAELPHSVRFLDDQKMRAQKLLEHLNTELNIPMGAHGFKSWAVGKTLVFFKQAAYERLAG